MNNKPIFNYRGKAMQEFAAELDKVMQWIQLRMSEVKPPKPDHAEFEHNDWSEESIVDPVR